MPKETMRVTLRDIAKRVNLSHATVSFVLNERRDISIPAATRDRVLAAARELGYRPNRAAQALARGRTEMVAVWLPLSLSPFYGKVMLEASRLLEADGFQAIVRVADLEGRYAGRELELDDWPVDGALLYDCWQSPQFAIEAGSVPVVSLGAFFDPAGDHVGIDLAAGMGEAVEHLHEQGCRRIAYLANFMAGRQDARRTAYLSGCAKLGLEPEVIDGVDPTRAGARSEIRARAAARGAPDAIIGHNDGIALASIKGLEDAGYRVPEDVLVVGCDGGEEAEFARPGLTTIVQPVGEACREAWSMLRGRIAAARAEHRTGIAAESPPTIGRRLLPARLIVRESSTRR